MTKVNRIEGAAEYTDGAVARCSHPGSPLLTYLAITKHHPLLRGQPLEPDGASTEIPALMANFVRAWRETDRPTLEGTFDLAQRSIERDSEPFGSVERHSTETMKRMKSGNVRLAWRRPVLSPPCRNSTSIRGPRMRTTTRKR